ncbi:MAG: metal-dependent hydrolase [Candidatus Aminicenantes bacterium]|nr:metal-dependent hydrolase [Candidatus Aminicenantes bacterium]NIM81165.1 metal-dependent hydrolase [Candidatus Aminicenantes bacterium]NIN20540.1 metal-dependent hydrolase [Candidatus Aminicenantes bacterium]NIN44319.1 metal-dependent hydrolase [Candidatus Aminicenantes bacterium]NIN87138.1 metal-dependent hydrolase [Candidatus Aminicenantes bacterium]
MKITWIGHSALKLEGSKTVFIDPFLTGNPAASMSLDNVTRADVVVVTHDHGDHLGDGYAICKKTGATLVSIFEIAEAGAKQGIKAEGMNIGGTVTVDGVAVSLVPAFHTAGLGGTATGAVVELDGKTVYHAGDTGLTMEMQLIGEMYTPDIAFLPIDGRFNMGPKMAAKAVELLNVSKVVPFHYDTFPLVHSSPEEFKKLVGDKSDVIIIKPGDFIEL